MVSKTDIFGIIPTLMIGTWINKQRNNYTWNDVYNQWKENAGHLVLFLQKMIQENQLNIQQYTFPNVEKVLIIGLLGSCAMMILMLSYSILIHEIRKQNQGQERRSRSGSKLKKILTLSDIDGDYSGPMTRSRSNGELYQLY